jgi:hypothetical protein
MRTSQRSHQQGPDDIGTLWTLRRDACTARCALMVWPARWEVRALVDGTILLAERCTRADEAFSLAERWKRQLLAQGWQQIVPPSRPAGAA